MSLRWQIKKSARLVCAGGRALRSAAPHGVRVLTYHRFARAHQDAFAVDPQSFERHMEWLAEHHLAVTLDDVLAHHSGTRCLAAGSVLVTIDDGFESLHRIALPVLQRLRIPAVAFLPAGLMQQAIAGDPEPRLSWSQIRELHAGGVSIGSHGWSHRSFGSLSDGEMWQEANQSRRLLEEQIGGAVDSFAYPFGTRADFGSLSAQTLREAGYRCAFTSQHGAVTAAADALELPRIKVEGGEPLWAFAASCAGGLDAWRFVDRCLWSLQARHA